MAKCMKCGGMKTTKMKKMKVGGSAVKKAPVQLYGIPQENMGTSGQYGMMKKGGAKKYADGGFPDLTGDGKVTQADVLKGRGVFKKGGAVAKAKFGASVNVQRSPKAGKVRSASAQGYSAVGKREPGRIIKKTIGKKK